MTSTDALLSQVAAAESEAADNYSAIVSSLAADEALDPATVFAAIQAAGKSTAHLQEDVRQEKLITGLQAVVADGEPASARRAELMAQLKGLAETRDKQIESAVAQYARAAEPLEREIEQCSSAIWSASEARRRLVTGDLRPMRGVTE